MQALEFTVADVRITPRAFPFLSILFIILLVLILVIFRPLINAAGDLIEGLLPFDGTTGYQVLINDMQSNYGVYSWSISSSEKAPFANNMPRGRLIPSNLSIAWCVVMNGQNNPNRNSQNYHYIVGREEGSWNAYRVEESFGVFAFNTLGCSNY